MIYTTLAYGPYTDFNLVIQPILVYLEESVQEIYTFLLSNLIGKSFNNHGTRDAIASV